MAEYLGLAPGLVRPQGRCAAVGGFHCYAAPRADDRPSREGGSPENLPGQELDPNRAPPENPPAGDSGASKVPASLTEAASTLETPHPPFASALETGAGCFERSRVSEQSSRAQCKT